MKKAKPRYAPADPVMESVAGSLRYITRKVFLPADVRQRLQAMDKEVLTGLSRGLEAVISEKKLERTIAGLESNGRHDCEINIYSNHRIKITPYRGVYTVRFIVDNTELMNTRLKYDYSSGSKTLVPENLDEL